jgi:hypothetical protein
MENAEKFQTKPRHSSPSVVFNTILAMVAILALGMQYYTLTESIHANSQQKQNEIALSFWEQGNQILLHPSVRTHVSQLKQWLASMPSENSSNEQEKASYHAWLNFFLLGSEISDTAYEALYPIPSHVRKYFILDETTTVFDKTEADKIRFATFLLLNFMKNIAIAYQQELATREILDDSMKDFVVENTKALEKFIRAATSINNLHGINWKPLKDLVLAKNGDWNPENAKLAP